MNMIMRLQFRLSLTALAGALLLASLRGEWTEGSQIPDLREFALEGNLSEVEGRVVYIDFWASWCAPCKASFPAIDSLYETYGPQGLEVIAVSVDETEKAMRRFVSAMEPSFPVLRDREQRLVANAGLTVMPTSYLVDREGVVRYVHVGWRGAASKEQLEARIRALLLEEVDDD